jgi:hypothetical protein
MVNSNKVIIMISNLGLAAVAQKKAELAIKEKRYDDAWRFYHEQAEYYDKHICSGCYPYTDVQVRCLQSKVDEGFANILRLQGKHKQALVHMVFWIGSNFAVDRKTLSMTSKLKAYFNRCKFVDATLYDAQKLIESFMLNTSTSMFVTTSKLINTWQ